MAVKNETNVVFFRSDRNPLARNTPDIDIKIEDFSGVIDKYQVNSARSIIFIGTTMVKVFKSRETKPGTFIQQ